MTASEFIPSGARDRKAATRGLSTRTKWVLGLVGGIILIAIGWHLVSGLLQSKPRTPPAPPVTVARASNRNVTVM